MREIIEHNLLHYKSSDVDIVVYKIVGSIVHYGIKDFAFMEDAIIVEIQILVTITVKNILIVLVYSHEDDEMVKSSEILKVNYLVIAYVYLPVLTKDPRAAFSSRKLEILSLELVHYAVILEDSKSIKAINVNKKDSV